MLLFVLAVVNFVVFLGSEGDDKIIALVGYFGLLLILGQSLLSKKIDSIRTQAATRPITVYITKDDWESDFRRMMDAEKKNP